MKYIVEVFYHPHDSVFLVESDSVADAEHIALNYTVDSASIQILSAEPCAIEASATEVEDRNIPTA